MKQLGLGIAQYAQDYDGYLPPASQWADATYPYDKNWDTYQCPDYPSSMYAYNLVSSKRSVAKITDPTTWPLAFDSNSTERNAVSNGFADIAFPPHHNEGNDVVFADFHVKWRKSAP